MNDGEAISKLEIYNAPKILIIQLKRFNERNGSYTKLDELIYYPIDNLDISRFVQSTERDSYKYNLYGIICHFGTLNSGHYTAFCKNAEGIWHEFNDMVVT